MILSKIRELHSKNIEVVRMHLMEGFERIECLLHTQERYTTREPSLPILMGTILNPRTLAIVS